MSRIFCMAFSMFMAWNGWAGDFLAGKDYSILDVHSSQPNQGNAVEVIEFFSYGCPWCYRLEPQLQKWIKQEAGSIAFSRVPVVFHADWKFYAKAYHIIRALNLSEQVSMDLFKSIIDDKKALNSNQAMIQFFAAHGVDKAIAESAFEHGVSIDMQLEDDARMLGRYRINGVPAFVVGGRYLTGLDKAKSPERLFEILSFLVHKVTPNPAHNIEQQVVP